MKIRDVGFENNELYKETRFNKNTVGMPLEVVKSEGNILKKRMGAMSILALETLCGGYDKAVAEISDKSMESIVSKMLENAKNVTYERSVKL